MLIRLGAKLALTFLVLLATAASGQGKKQKFELYHADATESIYNHTEDTVYAFRNVSFGFNNGIIYCDSAVYFVQREAKLWGNVIVDDPEYHLAADSARFEEELDLLFLFGDYVELWSKNDSILAIGTNAVFHRETEYFRMIDRPTLYLKYPDSAEIIEVIADTIEYVAVDKKAVCLGNVIINGRNMSATAGKAIMFPFQNRLELYRQPVVNREGSHISGATITIESERDMINRIEVTDSAFAEFDEPTDSTRIFFDRSELRGQRMTLDFTDGELNRLTCIGQAYSWYKPSSKGAPGYDENTASGDTIRFHITDNQLTQVDVIGGSLGTYVVAEETGDDTLATMKVDTIDYRAEIINYRINDSLISLEKGAHVTSGSVALEAAKIALDTRKRIIEAWSAFTEPGPPVDSVDQFGIAYEPNEIPVILKDGEDEFYGDYLEYSIDTEKGRIVTSKSAVERGTYYGENAYRSEKEVFYVNHGRYTPCDINYLHFYSRRMKFIEGEKLIAKPVIMYIGRIPVMVLPYYVFPLKKGRHSGFLPFTLGNLERGNQYIRNVGYYWAASEYWDWQGALDYYERRSTLNFYSQIRYRKRYVYDGYLSGNLTRETDYFRSPVSREASKTRWTIEGSHNHEFSPSLKISAKGKYQADPSYYQDYSANLDERLNRTIRSQLNFTKRFGRSVTASGRMSHDVNLDTESRTDFMPSLGVSLPVIRPFGSGQKNAEGRLEQNWYNNLSVSYRPSLVNYSRRDTRISSVDSLYVDTAFVLDTLTGLIDTIPNLTLDTTKYRTRREYSRADHAISVNFPLTLASYITFNPNLQYNENWYRIYQTDQSDAADIDPGNYRTYGYSAGVGLSTKLYGTVMPNVLGLKGLRQVITPSVSYSFVPKVDNHPEVRGYAGGNAGSSAKRQTLGISLNHIYQAKIAQGEGELNLELLSVTHSTGYNFEEDIRPWSGLNTSFTSHILPNVNLYGGMTHSFYVPGTNEVDLTSPVLENFDFNATVTTGGRRFLFDDPDVGLARGADSASQLSGDSNPPSGSSSGSQGWSLSLTYSYRESGLGDAFRKTAFIRFNLRFNLTPQTSVSYSQYYDFQRGRTINNQVSIVRQLNCWTGNFYWVPVGSNQGYGFRLYVTAIPAIKIDNSQNPLSSGYFQSLR